jgi:inositol transport system ATP-binding protein
LNRSAHENISLANLGKYIKNFQVDDKSIRADELRMKELLNIKISNFKVEPGTLSGGNQQKLVLAKWLVGNVGIMILDEPTRGIDVGSKAEIHRFMGELARQGVAIIMISSELPEIIGMSDRVAVLSQGTITGILGHGELTQEKIMNLAVKGVSK